MPVTQEQQLPDTLCILIASNWHMNILYAINVGTHTAKKTNWTYHNADIKYYSAMAYGVKTKIVPGDE